MSTDLTEVEEIKKRLARLNRPAKKSLGQHFLVAPEVLEQLLRAAALSKDDQVVEVGPGLGTVTLELCRRVRSVVAIELDRDFAQALTQTVASNNLTVLEGNILRLNFWLYTRGVYSPTPGAYKVVAALPYNIATAVIQLFLEADRPPARMVVLVQKEVAERLVAKPGNRARSALTVLTERLALVEYLATVPRNAFYPPPKVESAMIRITPKVVQPRVDRAFGRLVAAGFSAKRKQLANSLSGGLQIEKSMVITWLSRAGIDPTARAEGLSLTQWEELFARLTRDDSHLIDTQRAPTA